MGKPIIINPGCVPEISSRSVAVSILTDGYVTATGDDTDLLAWMNAFDMTTIPWGYTTVANFTSGFSISSAPNGPLINFAFPYYFSVVRNGHTGQNLGTPGGQADYVRTQIGITNLFCGQAGYMILGGVWNNGAPGSGYPVGCSTFSNPCNLIELPLIVDGGTSAGLAFGLIGSANYSVMPNVAPDLNTWLPSAAGYWLAGFNKTKDSHWDASLICEDSGDPFGGVP